MAATRRMNTVNRNRKNRAAITADRVLPVAVCASTFRNLYGREATGEELSDMTGIPAAVLIRFIMPVLSQSTEMMCTAPAV